MVKRNLTIITPRNLIALQRLYRFRAFVKNNDVSIRGIQKCIVTRTFAYTIYGNIGLLAPTQRIILREYLKSFLPFNDIYFIIKFFPTQSSKIIISYSNIYSIHSILKGTTYQMSLCIKNDTIKKEDSIRASKKITQFIEKRKTIMFFDDIYFDFTPFILSMKTYIGSNVPRRYGSFMKYLAASERNEISNSEILTFDTVKQPFICIKHMIFYIIISKMKGLIA